jgi:hypothetical protein
MKIFRVIVIIALIILGVYSLNAFINNKYRFDGMMFVLCGLLLGGNGFYDNFNEYKQTQKENSERMFSTIYRLTRSLALILFSIGSIIYIILNWNSLN